MRIGSGAQGRRRCYPCARRRDVTQLDTRTETATLAGGCFWCLEAVYEQLKGVEHVVNGYTGGQLPNPTYEQVCTGRTGHAEAVQVTYDPAVASYRDLVRLFFRIHDPTTLNRQWPDVGTQYRSAVYWHDDEQRLAAEEELEAARALWDDPIVTEIAPLEAFYAAEDYHQQYYRKNPHQGYCQVIIAPKVAKLRKEHLEALKA
ncbi:MAG: peptide-methionine (S)-S-oxide reductase MsrA [Dehalococcoidia bacterium]|nr:peptide-methionine (S)-S-oxide reductase MsrA [Dehalococcoidia bacterium]